MTANLTRRRMLAAAGIGTAAAAFTGAASAQCRNDVKWDETHEIVVVGAGGAGMAAAVKAAQTGAKDILVLEKLAFTGGNTLIAQGFIDAADPVRQPRQGIKDSPGRSGERHPTRGCISRRQPLLRRPHPASDFE